MNAVNVFSYEDFNEIRGIPNGKLIYREWEDGEWMGYDRDQIHNLNESVTDDLIDRVVTKLKPPYIYNLFSMGFNHSDSELILSKLFGERVYIWDNSYITNINVNDPTEWRIENKSGDVFYVEFDDGYFQDWRD